jgi:hypothetical protein
MRQSQVNKVRQSARIQDYKLDAQVLPWDPRDPDIVRAKTLQRASCPGAAQARAQQASA